MKTFIYLSLALVFLNYSNLKAQNETKQNYPEIGKLCPEFQLKNISTSQTKEASLHDFKGQFLILYFWNKNCVSCIESFPKLNQLQTNYKGKVNFILVGTEEDGIQEMYNKFRQKWYLEISTSFDFELYKRFVPRGTPHVVWIDQNGIVIAITNSSDLNDENIQSFIDERNFTFYDRSYKSLQREKSAHNLNSGNDVTKGLLYSSQLKKFDIKEMSYGGIPQSIDRLVETGRNKFEGTVTLKKLCMLAFTGYSSLNPTMPISLEFYNSPVLELEDPSEFFINASTGENIYWYRLIVPPSKATRKSIMTKLQHDFIDYFDYNASVQVRKMEYWKLTATEEARVTLLSHGGAKSYEGDHSGFKLENSSVKDLLLLIWSYRQTEPPFIDETQISGNINIKFNALMTDFQDVKNGLKKHGLNLVRSERDFKVIVVVDKERSN